MGGGVVIPWHLCSSTRFVILMSNNVSHDQVTLTKSESTSLFSSFSEMFVVIMSLLTQLGRRVGAGDFASLLLWPPGNRAGSLIV